VPVPLDRKMNASFAEQGRFSTGSEPPRTTQWPRVNDFDTQPAQGTPPQVFAVRGVDKAWVWLLLLGANVAVYAWMLLRHVDPMNPTVEDLIGFGASYGARVAEGEWWRLLTCTFLHGGLIHLAVNMWSLRILGPAIENLYGNAAFLLLYLFSGLGASVASSCWNPSGVSVGASGSITGLVGALVAFFVAHRHEMPMGLFRAQMRSVGLVILINAFIGISMPRVDNAAHLGGLVTGLACGFALHRALGVAPVLTFARFARLSIIAVALVGLVFVAMWRARQDPETAAAPWMMKALRAMEAGDAAVAKASAEKALTFTPGSAEALRLLARASLKLGDNAGGLAALDRAVEVAPTDMQSRSMRGQILFENGADEKALRDFDAVIAADPDDVWTFAFRGHVHFAMAHWEVALHDFTTAGGREESLAGEMQLFQWLCRARLGLAEQATSDLVKWSASGAATEQEAWTRTTASFFTGGISESQFLGELSRGKTQDGWNLEIRSLFFAAEKRAAAGDLTGARPLWARAKSIENTLPLKFEDVLYATQARQRLGSRSVPPR
jgi:membrane associated rhomboid family serine protease